MGLNDTPVSERVHIAFFGCRNAGKSSVLNAVTGQKIAVVSDVLGTTTDPVYKTMELLPAGPVVIIDTPGLDDSGELGNMRVAAALDVLKRTDVAVLVIDSAKGESTTDIKIIERLKGENIPFIVAYNKCDLLKEGEILPDRLYISAETGEGIFELKEKIAALANAAEKEKSIVGDLVKEGDVVLLVVPIDKAAPKGRLILPQQQVIRDLLENAAIPVTVRDSELPTALKRFDGMISLVITDSQVFGKVAGLVPENIPLTSFSILFSRYKGELDTQLLSITALKDLKEGDCVLVSEGCTHHRQCGDIGTVKIPAALKKLSGNKVTIETTSGREFPDDLSKYKAIVHCGGCMLNEKEMKSRIASSKAQGVPITNYGMVLALSSGVLERSVKALGITL